MHFGFFNAVTEDGFVRLAYKTVVLAMPACVPVAKHVTKDKTGFSSTNGLFIRLAFGSTCVNVRLQSLIELEVLS